MNRFFVLSLLAWPLALHAADEILINKQQMQTLGIVAAPLSAASPVMSNRLPGEIVVPVGQERIVSAAQAGLLDRLEVAAGQSVRKGQVLGHISSPELVALQRDYLQARTQHKLAGNMLERDKELYREGIIAERRLLTTQSSHDELSVTLEQRRQALRLAGLGESAIQALETSGRLSSGLAIVSPIDGVVLEQMAASGQRVDVSTPIYRIARLKPLWLEIHAPLDILHFAREGTRVSIPKYQAEGRITTIIRNINKNDQTVHLRAEITSGADKLMPGQFVEAYLADEAAGQNFSIPKSALVRTGQQSLIFVQTAKGFRVLPVEVVSEQSEHAVIRGNLTGRENVVVSGTAAVKAAWHRSGE